MKISAMHIATAVTLLLMLNPSARAGGWSGTPTTDSGLQCPSGYQMVSWDGAPCHFYACTMWFNCTAANEQLQPDSQATASRPQLDFTRLAVSLSSSVGQEHLITGFAHKTGATPGDCSFAPPPASEAEKNADQQAQSLCAAQGRAVRSSDFSYSTNDCVWGGLEYRYATDTVYAQALYKCE